MIWISVTSLVTYKMLDMINTTRLIKQQQQNGRKSGNLIYEVPNCIYCKKNCPLKFVLFKSDNPIVAIQITPIYESNSKNWIETTRIEVNSNQYELDLTKDFRRYSKYLKFVKFSVEQATESDVYLIGYGFRH